MLWYRIYQCEPDTCLIPVCAYIVFESVVCSLRLKPILGHGSRTSVKPFLSSLVVGLELASLRMKGVLLDGA